MKVKTKYAALASITQIWTSVRGKKYPQFQADVGVYNRKRIRITRSSKSECRRAVEDWYSQRAETGDAIVQLTPAQIADAITALDILKNAKCADKLSLIASLHVDRISVRDESKEIGAAYDEYYSKFSVEQESQREFVDKRVGKFVERMRGRQLGSITAADVRGWLDEHSNWSPCTWNQNMTYIKSFLSWCCKTSVGHCKANPIVDMEKKPVARKRVEVASPEAVAAVIGDIVNGEHECRSYMLMRFVLSYFCGMRTSEILRQRREDIHLDSDTLVVTEAKGMQSGGHGRSFVIPEQALEWLRTVDMDFAFDNQMADNTYIHSIIRIARRMKVTLPHNGGRHSFITYHIAKYGDPRRTEGIVGTSDSMRKNHYDAVGLKREGDAYFAITPASVAASTSAPST